MKENIVGYPVDVLSPVGCVESIAVALKGDRVTWLACFNPHSYAVSLKNEPFSKALNDADWLVADGAGVLLASKILGGSIVERVTGSDVFFGLNDYLNRVGGARVFFLGSTEEVLGDIRARIAVDYPNIVIAGTFSPPFKPIFSDTEIGEMIEAVNASGADVLWVGMTAPKQELWIHETKDKLNVKFVAAIGAVFDFYTGRVKRSHPIFQRMGLEWLPRLFQQPKRLWRRTFVSAPIFVWHVISQKLGFGS